MATRTQRQPHEEQWAGRELPADDLTTISDKVDNLADKIQTLTDMIGTADMPAQSELTPVVKRRSEDDVKRAIKVLASGGVRPRDDESEQILTDCLNEMIWNRQIIHSTMQSGQNVYQSGLTALRKMTERR